MKKRKWTKYGFWISFVFLIELQCTLAFSSNISIITKLEQIIPAIDSETLIVFDVDNTLISPKGYFGSDEWFYYLVKIKRFNGLSEKEATDQAVVAWNKAQQVIEVKTVEDSTLSIIQKFKSSGHKMMALTARNFDIYGDTLRQLRSVGIGFKDSPVYDKAIRISKELLSSPEDAVFENGILFVGEHNDKGKVLSYFLKEISFMPKKVVYVDDRMKHVQSVDRYLGGLVIPAIPHTCFRYGGADAKIEQFNSVMSEVKDRETFELFLLGN